MGCEIHLGSGVKAPHLSAVHIPRNEGDAVMVQLGVLLEAGYAFVALLLVRAGVPMVFNVVQQLNVMEPGQRHSE